MRYQYVDHMHRKEYLPWPCINQIDYRRMVVFEFCHLAFGTLDLISSGATESDDSNKPDGEWIENNVSERLLLERLNLAKRI